MLTPFYHLLHFVLFDKMFEFSLASCLFSRIICCETVENTFCRSSKSWIAVSFPLNLYWKSSVFCFLMIIYIVLLLFIQFRYIFSHLFDLILHRFLLGMTSLEDSIPSKNLQAEEVKLHYFAFIYNIIIGIGWGFHGIQGGRRDG